MIQTYKAKLANKKELTENTVLLTFNLVEPNEIQFIAGQYVLINVPKADGQNILRHFSFVNPPSVNNKLELLVKLLPDGVASNYLRQMQVEEEMTFKSPFGLFTLHESERNRIFLATGTGIAPIMSILKSKNSNLKTQIHLFWGLREMKDLYFLDELKQLEKESQNFKFHICLSQEKDFSSMSDEDKKYFISGRVNTGLEQVFPVSRFTFHDFYVCGDRLVVESLRQYLYSKGALKEQVYFEKF